MRFPGRVSKNLHEDDIEEIQRFFVRATTIASKMGAYTQSLVQFEDRDQKRESIGSPPDVSEDECYGRHIGQWALIGHGADQLQEEIAYALENPEKFRLEYQDDAEDFAGFLVDIPMQSGVDRPSVVRTMKPALREKNLRLTPQATSVMQAFCDSPHVIAKAIHYLAPEDGRKVRIDDLKYGLTASNVPAKQILPTTSGSVKSKLVHALLTSTRPLSQKELVDRAGVSAQSFRNHREELQAFEVIQELDEGWIVSLPYREADLDGKDGLPYYTLLGQDGPHADRKCEADELKEESIQGALYEAMLVLEDTGTFSDPDHPVAQPIYGSLSESDLETLRECRLSWRGLIRFVVALREESPLAIGDESVDAKSVNISVERSTVKTGRPPDQAGMSSFESQQASVTGD